MATLLDLFCGAGGAAMGYYRAGFDVVGVDIKPQPRYPFRFIQDDAIRFLKKRGAEFDAIHASPPCQAYSAASAHLRKQGREYPDLIAPVRRCLKDISKPYVIENVAGAPLVSPIMLCGTMFGLGVFRHRYFESNVCLFAPPHLKHDGKLGDGKYFCICGGAGKHNNWGRKIHKGTKAEWSDAMGIHWMTRKELTQAIPPAYTEFIGRQLLNYVELRRTG